MNGASSRFQPAPLASPDIHVRLSSYVEAALKQAVYERDEDGVIIAQVPAASGFFTQGDSFEEARDNLRDAIEGNVLLALQLGFDIP